MPIISHLGYGNSLITGLPASTLPSLFIFCTVRTPLNHKLDHINSLLKSLHRPCLMSLKASSLPFPCSTSPRLLLLSPLFYSFPPGLLAALQTQQAPWRQGPCIYCFTVRNPLPEISAGPIPSFHLGLYSNTTFSEAPSLVRLFLNITMPITTYLLILLSFFSQYFSSLIYNTLSLPEVLWDSRELAILLSNDLQI